LAEVAATCRSVLERRGGDGLLILDDQTGETVEVDFRGSAEDVVGRLPAMPSEAEAAPVVPRGPGRPKLGVVAREVTLLPRHWEWLNGQPGGASVALRKLVEAARREGDGEDQRRLAQERGLRILTVMAGDRPGYEEATRALFAGDRDRFQALLRPWPGDVREYIGRLSEGAFAGA
jgi:hypothetical protein